MFFFPLEQGYDSANVMAGRLDEVQTLVLDPSPRAI